MKRITFHAAIGILTLLVTACGGAAPASNGTSPAAGASKPAAASAAGAPSPQSASAESTGPSAASKPALSGAASGPTIDAIKQKKELVIGLEAAFPPFETLDNGKFSGFDVDLGNLVAAGLGAQPKFIDTEYPGLVPGLQQKKFDVVISAIVITADRAKQVDFSQPYAESTQKLMVRADDDRIKSQDDLRGKTVAVQAGTTSEQLVRKLDEDFKKNGAGLKNISVFDHTPEMFLELDAKRADAAITLLPSAALMMKTSPNKYKAASDFGAKSYVGIVTRKDTPDLGQYMDVQLSEIKQSGKLAELETSWFGAKSSGLPDHKLY